jgi:predicted ferric reductase
MEKSKIGLLFIALFCLIPLLIWVFMQPISTRFANLAGTMTSLGQLMAIIGITLLGLTFFLSTRLKFIENLFGGLGRVNHVHHWVGTLAFLLLLFHPIFLAVKYATFSIASAISFILPGTSWAIDFGIYSILGMTLFLIFTFFIKLDYKRWKFTHQLLGIAFILSIVHVLLITSDISRSFALRGYIFLVVIIGVLSFLYKTVLNGWIGKNKVNENTIKK